MKNKNTQGLTLIELVVGIAVFAGLTIGLYFAFNSSSVIKRTYDTKRTRDINEIKKAVELYYQDNQCFPNQDEFNQLLSQGAQFTDTVIYMEKLPIDPDRYAYIYKTDEDSTCPQWMGIFTKLSMAPSRYKACPMYFEESCSPQGLDATWGCATSGLVDCEYITGTTIELGPKIDAPTPLPTNYVQPTNTPNPSTTPGGPTNTPTPPSCTPKDYKCTGAPLRCNIVPAGTGDYCSSDCNGAC